MPSGSDRARYRKNWQGEVDSVWLYTALSRSEKNPQLAKVYARLAAVEEKHAQFWEKKMRDVGAPVPKRSPSFRSRTLGFLAKRFGARFVLPAVTNLENSDRGSYSLQPESKHTSLPSDEHSHARLLSAISGTAKSGMEGGTLARLEGRHRAMGGNALRAAVLGANDGLVSNLSLIMGVAGADLPQKTILITGLAGLLAGACSMAMGEWLSVQSARELYMRQIAVEEEELLQAPEEEEEELALIYEAKGMTREEARKLASTLIKDEATALNTLSREELGIDPESLGGSAWEAAFTSFFLFCIGAIIPLLPFIFLHGPMAVGLSLSASAAALFLVGALITLLTGRGIAFSGVRQLVIGLLAAAVTFGIGRFIGTSIAG